MGLFPSCFQGRRVRPDALTIRASRAVKRSSSKNQINKLNRAYERSQNDKNNKNQNQKMRSAEAAFGAIRKNESANKKQEFLLIAQS